VIVFLAYVAAIFSTQLKVKEQDLNFSTLYPQELEKSLTARKFQGDIERFLYVRSLEATSKIAEMITVKVLVDDIWGSGILISRKGQVYTILTNEHVLRSGEKYRVQTHDNQIYTATTYTKSNLGENDLGLLQFKSPQIKYDIAFLGRAKALLVGERVIAVGYPLATDTKVDVKIDKISQNLDKKAISQQHNSHENGLKYAEGRFILITDKPLDDGYQVGYDSAVEKGMSGGPVLNMKGEVVAINGMHAYPIWGDPYVYRDGTIPCPPMHELMIRSSWAIPAETFIHVTHQSLSLKISQQKPKISSLFSSGTDYASISLSEALQFQNQALAAKSCTPFNNIE